MRLPTFCAKLSVFSHCFMHGVKSSQIPTHNQRKENTTKHLTFVQICCHFVSFCVYSTRLMMFGEHFKTAREHCKLRHFNTTKKTRENTRLLYELAVILYFARVFDMFFLVFLNGKKCDFRPRNTAGKLP